MRSNIIVGTLTATVLVIFAGAVPAGETVLHTLLGAQCSNDDNASSKNCGCPTGTTFNGISIDPAATSYAAQLQAPDPCGAGANCEPAYEHVFKAGIKASCGSPEDPRG